MAAKRRARKGAAKKTQPADGAVTAETTSTPKRPLSTVAIIWVAVFIVLCVGVILALKFLVTTPEDLSYNGYPFVKDACPATDDDCYFAELQIRDVPYTIQFFHHPSAVDDIPFDYAALEAIRSARERADPRIIIGVPDGAPGQIGIAGSQLGRVLGKRYGILDFDVTAQVIGQGEGKVDCDDARTNTVVIAFRQGTEDGVQVPSPNCIAITAKDAQSSIAVADAFVYRVFGIIRTTRTTAPNATTPSPPSVPQRTNASP